MSTDQLSLAPCPSRASSHVTLPSSSLKRSKPALLKFRVASLLHTLFHTPRTLNSAILWAVQPRLPLSFTLLTSPSSLVRTRSSIAPFLVGSCTTWKRKLSTHSRNLWFLLPCYVVSPKDIWMVEVLHWGPWFLNVKLSLSVCRGSKKKK